jgi:hypothetical protein
MCTRQGNGRTFKRLNLGRSVAAAIACPLLALARMEKVDDRVASIFGCYYRLLAQVNIFSSLFYSAAKYPGPLGRSFFDISITCSVEGFQFFRLADAFDRSVARHHAPRPLGKE